MRRSIALLPIFLLGCESAPTRESDTLADVRPLTAGFAGASEGRVSGDGKWVIFRAVPPGEQRSQMYVAPVRRKSDTTISAFGPPVRITPDGTTNAAGTCSPDAASLVFSSSARGDSPTAVPTRTSMSIFRADGWQAAMAVVEPGAGFDFAKHPITRDADARNLDATFTPDGRWIVFASDRDGANPDLWAMRADGSRAQRLTTSADAEGSPAISPDGKRICFRRSGPSGSQLLLADVVADEARITLEKERPLTSNEMANYAACWHPSGKFLLFTAATPSTVGVGDDVWLIRDDGYRRCRITFAPGFDGLPTFAADGRQLIWTSNRTADGTAQLYVGSFRIPAWAKNPDIRRRG